MALRENQAFLNFVEGIKALQKEAEDRGVDLSKAIAYLEKGEASPDLLRIALSELAQKDAEEFKRVAESSGRPMSKKEISETEPRTKYGKIIEEFNFFMVLPTRKKKIEFQKTHWSKEEPLERKTLKEILQEGNKYSAEWAEKVLGAREEFQRTMWDELRKYVELWQSKEGLTPPIREELTHYSELLMQTAGDLAERYGIGRYEIFNPEKDFEWYISKGYVGGNDFRE